jgi:hypothetical protein
MRDKDDDGRDPRGSAGPDLVEIDSTKQGSLASERRSRNDEGSVESRQHGGSSSFLQGKDNRRSGTTVALKKRKSKNYNSQNNN